MKTITPRLLVLSLVWTCCAAAPRPALAQEWGDASTFYSKGVQAYFAGRSGEAEQYLSQALILQPGDPRLYYFRALSLMRQGRLDEARGDMMLGANIEARHKGRFAVGTALERVQGPNRLMLERFRRQGHADLAPISQQSAQPIQNSQPQTFDPRSEVVRQRAVISIDQFMRPGGPRPLTDEELAGGVQPTAQSGRAGARPVGEDPFEDDPVETADRPATPPAPTADEPADETAEVLPEAELTPEAELQPEAEAMPEEAEAPQSEEDADPFGGL